MSFHVRTQAGTLLSRLNYDVRRVAQLLPVLFHTLLRAPLVLAGALVLMLRTSLVLTAITVGAVTLYLVATIFVGGLVRASYRRQSRSQGAILSISQEALQGIRVIKAFGAERAEGVEMERELSSLADEEMRGDIYTAEIPAALNQLATMTAIILVVVAGLGLITAGELTEPGLILFVLTAVAILGSSVIVAESIVAVYGASASSERMFEVLDVRPALMDGPESVQRFERGLELRGVSFSFGDAPVLREVDLAIGRGDVIGIVGPSGSGKSTLADLILRLYDPTSGEVRLDGVDVRTFTQESYRRLFGVVPQETLLFHDTIRANIAYGRDLSDEDVRVAARIANADGFIMAMPRGYDTVIGERGTRLSGGERQRIAIARAIASRPPILVFDEATSALDTTSERIVQAAIEDAIRDRTAIVIAHRISTVRSASRIAVVQAGRIVEIGTHEELLAVGGVYRALHDAPPVTTGTRS